MPDDHNLENALSVIGTRADCRVLPPAGKPSISQGLVIPADLVDFYDRCGGLLLFEGAVFPWRVSSPSQLIPAGPRLLGGHLQATQIASDYPDDVTTSCYIIADDGSGDSTAPHVVIDLHPDRCGRCYAVAWDTYGLVDDMPIVALNMADLITWLLEAGGDHASGADRPYGDAYQPE